MLGVTEVKPFDVNGSQEIIRIEREIMKAAS